MTLTISNIVSIESTITFEFSAIDEKIKNRFYIFNLPARTFYQSRCQKLNDVSKIVNTK